MARGEGSDRTNGTREKESRFAVASRPKAEEQPGFSVCMHVVHLSPSLTTKHHNLTCRVDVERELGKKKNNRHRHP
jgi:hypothetical protein